MALNELIRALEVSSQRILTARKTLKEAEEAYIAADQSYHSNEEAFRAAQEQLRIYVSDDFAKYLNEHDEIRI